MTVGRYQFVNNFQTFDNDPNEDPMSFKRNDCIHDALKDLIKEAIVSNTDVRIEANDEILRYEPKGQALEVAMIQFLLDNGEDVQSIFINRNRATPKMLQIPFDQDLKRTVVVRSIYGENSKEFVRVYVKGAPEEVVPLCW